ncbi:MAG: 2-dehydro-3-deoxygalactonokinase [Lewinella sp.]
MKSPTHFFSCDWGTTNFRLRVVSTEDLTVLAEHASNWGVKALNDRFGESDRTDRLFFFAEFLRLQLETFPEEHRHHPIIVSGMASANIGMRDLPYAELPIAPGGLSFVFQDLTPWPGQILRLISGVQSNTGMMRGEETQALGLLHWMDAGEEGVLLLPGTHSKHLLFRDGKFVDFSSYMTGELFDVLTKQSILVNSVAPGEWTSQAGEAFRDGVRTGYAEGFTSHLFSIRASQILRKTAPTDNYYHLSGLLIGDELSRLPQHQNIYLAGSGPLLRLYRFAMETVMGASSLTVFQGDELARALLAGQREIMLRP